MPTTSKHYRMSGEALAALERLGRAWGGTVQPIDATAVIHEAIRRADDLERRRGKLKTAARKAETA